MKDVRNLKRLSQVQLANKIAATQPEICAYEMGKRMPSKVRQEAIEKALKAAGCIDWTDCNRELRASKEAEK